MRSNHAVKFSKSTWHHIEFRERKDPSRGFIHKCEPHERSLTRPSLRRGHKRKPCTKKDAPVEQHGTWRNIFTSSKIRTKLRSTLPFEARATPAPTSKILEERQFLVDSRASMHMLSKKDLSSAEIDTLWRSRIPTTVVTANGEVQTNEEAQVYVHDLGLFVTVQLLEDTLAVLSFGKLFEEHGYSYEWTSGQRLQLTRQGEGIISETDNYVPCIFPGLSSSSGTTFLTSTVQD